MVVACHVCFAAAVPAVPTAQYQKKENEKYQKARASRRGTARRRVRPIYPPLRSPLTLAVLSRQIRTDEIRKIDDDNVHVHVHVRL